MLSAGPISHDCMQLLKTTYEFVALSHFTGYFIFICALFLLDVELERPVSS